MAAYNVTQPVDATGEQTTEQQLKERADVFPNFNGQAGTPYNGNFSITGANDLSQGLLWTAHYAVIAPDTITIQFSSPLVSASTTVGDYTLSGSGAPSITSVAWNAGSREILLNLSGPLSSVITYTLAIGANKVRSGSQISYRLPKPGVYNWPGLVVDVIQPATVAVVGVGVDQIITLGSPSMQTAGDAQSVGIDQTVDLGDPVVTTLLLTDGVGVDQPVDFGTPTADPDATGTATGINQLVGVGTPVIVQQQQPLGVGINQTIDVGTPVADITPITVSAAGINQTIGVGTPVCAGPIDTIGGNITQTIDIGTPIAARLLDRVITGVGVDQTIDVGTTPTSDLFPIAVSIIGISQDILVGTSPVVEGPDQPLGVGIAQLVGVGTPIADINPITVDSVGISQAVDFGEPSILMDQMVDGVGIDQTVDFGSPTVTMQDLTGVGIEQIVDIGTPVIAQQQPVGVGISQLVDLGTPVAALQEWFGVGIEQIVDIGTPSLTQDQQATATGIEQPIGLGSPVVSLVIPSEVVVGVGFEQPLALGTPVVAVPLQVTTRQAAVMLDIDDALHKAFGDGVSRGAFFPDIISKIDGYTDDFTTLQQDQTRLIFKNVAAAAITTLNIPDAFSTTNNDDSVLVAKVEATGSNGSMVFVDGILTFKVEPTGPLACTGIGIEQGISLGTPTAED